MSKFRTIPDYLDKIAATWEAEHVRERDEPYHPEDAMGQILPFANAFLLGWSAAISDE